MIKRSNTDNNAAAPLTHFNSTPSKGNWFKFQKRQLLALVSLSINPVNSYKTTVSLQFLN